MKNYELHTLPNGIRLIHKQVKHTKIAHCGFILDIGSRDEMLEEQGIAHFWEHMAFKGTKKRRTYHILNRLEVLGGELNAYTSKEKMCFYASVLNIHFEKAIELLTDITFHSIFPDQEIEREKSVILEEMASYTDSASDAIYDQFDNIIFGTHPLGRDILGTTSIIRTVTREHFLDFMHKNLSNERLVFSSVSSLPFSVVIKLTKKYLSEIPHYHAENRRTSFTGYIPKHQLETKPITQTHRIIGTEGYSRNHLKKLPLRMLTDFLGGKSMNSRLNMLLREKHGLVYSIEAETTLYQDTGCFLIYFATDEKSLERCSDLTIKELNKIKTQKLGIIQLQRIKQQFMGQLAMAEENNLSEMLFMGTSMLNKNYINSLEQIFQEIEQITAQDLQDTAQEIFDEDNLSYLTYVPKSTS